MEISAADIVRLMACTHEWAEQSTVTLGEVIAHLKTLSPDARFKVGFREACSDRGYYSEVAFIAADDVSAAEMLACAEAAVGAEMDGWKGGDYTMSLHTPAHFTSEYGAVGIALPLRLFGSDRWNVNYVAPPEPPSPEEQIEAILAKHLDGDLNRKPEAGDRGDLASDLADWFHVMEAGR